MKELEELTRDIREKLPRLMELSEGCIVDFKDMTVKFKVTHVFRDLFQNNYYLSSPVYYGDPEPRGRQVFKYNEQDFISEYSLNEGIKYGDVKIIGKEPMLNDVLEWHQDNYSKNSHFEVETFSAEDIKYSIGCFYSYDSDAEIEKYFWNLSKPYLKDQSPELIKFLHGLISQ